MTARSASGFSDDEEPVCWICLSGDGVRGQLVRPCACPRLVHDCCLARWRLHCAGKREEVVCRFCTGLLPDWRHAHAALPKAPPIMTVMHEERTHFLHVAPGHEGRREFHKKIRTIFGLGDADAISLTFGCKAPETAGGVGGDDLTLEGWEAYDAAVHCAAISAGQRQARAAAAATAPATRPNAQQLHPSPLAPAPARSSIRPEVLAVGTHTPLPHDWHGISGMSDSADSSDADLLDAEGALPIFQVQDVIPVAPITSLDGVAPAAEDWQLQQPMLSGDVDSASSSGRGSGGGESRRAAVKPGSRFAYCLRRRPQSMSA